MAEYLAPGVYVEEIEVGGKSIEGVSTSTAGFIGETERGPTDPRLVTGPESFYRIFGKHSFIVQGKQSNSYLPSAVEGFFLNGGKRCFVTRVVGKKAKTAFLEIRAIGVDGGGKSQPTETALETGGEKKKGPPSSPSDLHGQTGNPAVAVKVTALGPGSWGNRVAVEISQASQFVEGHAIKGKLFKATVMYWDTEPKDREKPPVPLMVESYDNCSLDPASPDYFEKRANNRSAFIWVETTGNQPPSIPPKGRTLYLENGADGGDLVLGDYTGDPEKGEPPVKPGQKKGLMACAEIDEINIMCAPNENDIEGLTGELIAHCELLKDRFAIIQAKKEADLPGKLRPSHDSKYAGFYYPWIWTIDKFTGNKRLVPPGGHLAGIYARTDNERGVHKAPANEVVRGAVGLQFPVNKAEQEILNPRGVNCIRAFEGRGIRVWGARTTSSDPNWKYLNVRRLFLYLEESIEEGTQ
ncbi:MAG: phage tail sheath family protein [Nitrospira sp.]|nr:phage tail sheath family protein [Nitrospira sp.]